MRRRSIRIGTSGWHYRGWIGDFYPPGTRLDALLSCYLDCFRAVEVNNSFYRLPAEGTFAAWKSAVPKDFRFAVKASRFITHNKKLKDSAGAFDLLHRRMLALGGCLGPILFQLPPRWRYNGERLADFLSSLPKGPLYAFEFRDPSWFRDGCYALLDRHGAGFCQYHWHRERTPEVATGKLAYVRFHGTRGTYGGSYSRRALAGWARKLDDWAAEGREAYAFFNNDAEGYAPWNALTLMEILGIKGWNRGGVGRIEGL